MNPNQEKVYTISSGETDATQRYVMRFNALQAKMSSHLTTLIQLSHENESTDFGLLENVDAKSLQIIDKYVKYYGFDDKYLQKKMDQCTIEYYKICRLPISERIEFDFFEKGLLGEDIFYKKNYTQLAQSALYLNIVPLIYALAKSYAKVAHYLFNRNNHIEMNIIYRVLMIEPIENDEMRQWKCSDTCKNFITSLHIMDDRYYDAFYILKPLIDVLSLTQYDTNHPMYYLGAYFPIIFGLISIPMWYPRIEGGMYGTFKSVILPECTDFEFERFFNWFHDDEMGKIKYIYAGHVQMYMVMEYISEFQKFTNLKRIIGIETDQIEYEAIYPIGFKIERTQKNRIFHNIWDEASSIKYCDLVKM